MSTAIFTESPELSSTAKSPWRQAGKGSKASAKTHRKPPEPRPEPPNPFHVGSHGKGWPRWSPCPSRPRRRRPPRQLGRLRSYEGCLPQLPSQPAGEPPVLGTQRQPVSLQLVFRAGQRAAHARRVIKKCITFECIV